MGHGTPSGLATFFLGDQRLMLQVPKNKKLISQGAPGLHGYPLLQHPTCSPGILGIGQLLGQTEDIFLRSVHRCKGKIRRQRMRKVLDFA